MAVAGCSAPVTPASPAIPASVALASSKQIQTSSVTIGLLVGPLDGEGSEYRQVANGAEVAGFRFGLGGLTVNFKTVSEDGTADSAKKAMQTLIEAGVTGVIVADAGPHLADALDAASTAGIATLLPYDYANQVSAPIYRTGPSAETLAAGLKTALANAHVSRPVVVSQNGYEITGVTDDVNESLTYVGDPVTTASAVTLAISNTQADAVIIEAPAVVQADIVTHIQALLGDKQLPIILTPQALTPAFAAGLGPVADLRGVLITVGRNTDDMVALQTGPQGDNMSAFLQAVRMAADSPTARNIFGDDSFASAAAYADTASHDAVVCLVRAAEQVAAGSAATVSAALGGLSLDINEGLAGGLLKFSSTETLAANQVITLYGSSQNPGLRPQPTDNTVTRLSWVGLG